MEKIKIHYCGSEGINWALDHDLQHLVQISGSHAEIVPLAEADLVHSVWWRGLQRYSPRELTGKKLITSIADSPQVLMTSPEHLPLRNRVDCWLSEYRSGVRFLEDLKLPVTLFPDPIDTDLFFPASCPDTEKRSLKLKLGIPEDRYLISNFHRDSSGACLQEPKKQKGADLLLEIAIQLKQKGVPAYWLLAGPRRHFLRNNFRKYSIPYHYYGEEIEGDDSSLNTVPLSEIAQLIRGVDLYLVTSRWEGAPNAVLEAAASKTKILSTEVGQAPDILNEDQIESTASAFAEKIQKDYKTDWLSERLTSAYDIIHRNHALPSIRNRLKEIHQSVLKQKNTAKIASRRFWIFKNKHYSRKLGRCFEKETLQSSWKKSVIRGKCQWFEGDGIPAKKGLCLDDRDPSLEQWIEFVQQNSGSLKSVICSSAVLQKKIHQKVLAPISSIVLHPSSSQGGFKSRSSEEHHFKRWIYNPSEFSDPERERIEIFCTRKDLFWTASDKSLKFEDGDALIQGALESPLSADLGFKALEMRLPILTPMTSVTKEWGMIGVTGYREELSEERLEDFYSHGYITSDLIWLNREDEGDLECIKWGHYLVHGFFK